MPEPDRVDRVEIRGGSIHQPAELREAAEKANRAGLAGFTIRETHYGMLRNFPLHSGEKFPGVYFTIEYERAGSALMHAATAALHLCDSLLAVREGATDVLIQGVREALAAALKEENPSG